MSAWDIPGLWDFLRILFLRTSPSSKQFRKHMRFPVYHAIGYNALSTRVCKLSGRLDPWCSIGMNSTIEGSIYRGVAWWQVLQFS